MKKCIYANKDVRNVGNTIENGKTWKQEVLIDTLNPIITGWANYHRSVVSQVSHSKIETIGRQPCAFQNLANFWS